MSSQLEQDRHIRSLDDIETVVDTDFHITEKQSDFINYINSPFDKMLLSGNGGGAGDVLGDLYPNAGVFTPLHTGNVDMESVRTKQDVIEGMELLNTDQVVATPTKNLYLSCVQHDELAAALGNAYTEWVLDKIADVNKGIYTPVVVAPQKPNKAAEQIDDKADEDAITAVYVPPSGVHPPLGHEKYHPIYEAAQDADLPLMFHNTSGGGQLFSFPMQFVGHNRYISNHVNTHPFLNMTHMLDIITRGIPERFPDLNFVFQEAGIGYVPYFMRRFDNEYSEKREDVPMLEHPPSEYIRKQFHFTSQPVEGLKDPEYVRDMFRHMKGVDTLMFSSDYPHFDFDNSDQLLQTLRPQLDDDELNAVYGKTAQNIFQF
jgi:predicted TIM-barrel fold metal-dependent hydrolase